MKDWLRGWLPDRLRPWLDRVEWAVTRAGRWGRMSLWIWSPRRPPPAISDGSRAYLAAWRRHLAGGPEPPLPPGMTPEELLHEVVLLLDEETRDRLARGELRGLRELRPVLERGIRLAARIEELGSADAEHLWIGLPPGSGCRAQG